MNKKLATKARSNQRQVYKVRNWSDYNKSLIKRGSIFLWLSHDMAQCWYDQSKPQKRGRSPIYSDACIELCLTIKALYRLSYRQVEGYLESLFDYMNVKLRIPSYTQMSRRAQELRIPLKRFPHKGHMDVVLDSTGLKVYGEGEWKVRQHGTSKRRTWKKLHLAIDPLDHEIVAVSLTPSGRSDGSMLSELIDEIPEPLDRVFADGAYDHSDCYHTCFQKGCHLITPPRRNAVLQSKDPVPWLDTRDQALKRITKLKNEIGLDEARVRWKYESDYHQRSLAETAMYRFKRLLGPSLWSLKQASQKVEAMIKVNIINAFTCLGMPQSMPVIA